MAKEGGLSKSLSDSEVGLDLADPSFDDMEGKMIDDNQLLPVPVARFVQFFSLLSGKCAAAISSDDMGAKVLHDSFFWRGESFIKIYLHNLFI